VVHPNGTGTCAWVIWANAEVWSGEGYVPGPVMDMYSGLAEVYGIYTMLSFFQQYLLLYPITFPQKQTIHIYCDNNGVIEQLQQTYSSHQYPREAIRDDYPIFAEVQALLQAMPAITALFHHVKGHQKETADCKLTLPEKLNIDCDSRAATLQPPPSTAPHCTHPLNSAGHPHLVIQGNVITQRLQHTLRDAATKHTYFDYLTEKFHWTENPEQAIHWPIL